MAKGNQTFQKRQRENKLREKAQQKRQQREQRKREKRQLVTSDELPTSLAEPENPVGIAAPRPGLFGGGQ